MYIGGAILVSILDNQQLTATEGGIQSVVTSTHGTVVIVVGRRVVDGREGRGSVAIETGVDQ